MLDTKSYTGSGDLKLPTTKSESSLERINDIKIQEPGLLETREDSEEAKEKIAHSAKRSPKATKSSLSPKKGLAALTPSHGVELNFKESEKRMKQLEHQSSGKKSYIKKHFQLLDSRNISPNKEAIDVT